MKNVIVRAASSRASQVFVAVAVVLGLTACGGGGGGGGGGGTTPPVSPTEVTNPPPDVNPHGTTLVVISGDTAGWLAKLDFASQALVWATDTTHWRTDRDYLQTCRPAASVNATGLVYVGCYDQWGKSKDPHYDLAYNPRDNTVVQLDTAPTGIEYLNPSLPPPVPGHADWVTAATVPQGTVFVERSDNGKIWLRGTDGKDTLVYQAKTAVGLLVAYPY